jgi:hypothetical protein
MQWLSGQDKAQTIIKKKTLHKKLHWATPTLLKAEEAIGFKFLQSKKGETFISTEKCSIHLFVGVSESYN